MVRLDGSGATILAGRDYRGGLYGGQGFSGDDGPATDARFDKPGSIAVEAATGDVYVCDNANKRIRRIDRAGTITTAVGDGTWRGPFKGSPTDVAIDAAQVGIDGRGHVFATAATPRTSMPAVCSWRHSETANPRSNRFLSWHASRLQRRSGRASNCR